MPRKIEQSKANPEQYKRFLETAEQVEASEDEDAFDRAFGRVARPVVKTDKPLKSPT